MENRLKGLSYFGLIHKFIKLLSKCLNYTIHFVSTNNFTSVAYIFAKLTKSEINVTPLPVLTGTNYY